MPSLDHDRLAQYGADIRVRSAEVARIMNADPATVTRWAREGLLPCRYTKGGHRLYRVGDIPQAWERIQASLGRRRPASPLQAARYARRLTGEQVAAMIRDRCPGHNGQSCRFSQNRLSDYERGKRGPSWKHLACLQDIYQATPQDLGYPAVGEEPAPVTAQISTPVVPNGHPVHPEAPPSKALPAGGPPGQVAYLLIPVQAATLPVILGHLHHTGMQAAPVSSLVSPLDGVQPAPGSPDYTDDEWVGTAEGARLLGVPRVMLIQWARQGVLAYECTGGGHWLFQVGALRRLQAWRQTKEQAQREAKDGQ